MKGKGNVCLYLAGAVLIVYILVRLLFFGVSSRALIELAGFLLAAISGFASVPALACGVLLSGVIDIVFYGWWGIYSFMYLLPGIFMCIAGLAPKSGKLTGILAGILYLLIGLFGVSLFYGRLIIPSLNVLNLVYYVLPSLAFVILGFGFSGMNATCTVSNSTPPRCESNLDRLIRLKDMLDRGLITQEEFEAKKREIIGY